MGIDTIGWLWYIESMKGILALAMGLLPVMAQQPLPAEGDAAHAPVTENLEERNERMSWWREAKLGMFIHYGLYSGLAGEFQGRAGGGEWIQKNLELDSESYAQEALPLFRPAKDCTEAWAALAEQAGCRYVVLTTKHHEGFALWDTTTTDYCAGAALGRDLVREYVESCRRHGLRVGFYHSMIDWHHPSYDFTINPDLCYPTGQMEQLVGRGIPRQQAVYQDYLHEQVRELLTRYGQVDILWWDYSQDAAEGERAWRAPKLMEMCRRLQPGIIMNNRLYSFSGFDRKRDGLQLDWRCGDFTTPEKRIPEQGYPGIDWESCMTVGRRWGYTRDDVEIKSPAVIIRQLEECVARGGNLLLNIGPRGDGSIPEALVEVFTRIGAWMRVNGEAVYGSVPLETVRLPEGCMGSMSGESMYVFLPADPPSEDYVLRVPAVDLDEVEPSILGQLDCRVVVRRVELAEEGEEEPQACMEFIIPASAWQQAVEGMPVLKWAYAL